MLHMRCDVDRVGMAGVGVREKSGIYVYFQAHCGQCEWTGADRRRDDSEAWNDLQGHLRHNHSGNVSEVRVRRTVIEEALPPREDDENEVIPMPLAEEGDK